MKFSGVPESVKTRGEPDASSTPVLTGAQPVVSSSDLNTRNSKGMVSGSSIPNKPIGKTAASAGLGNGGRGKVSASSGAKGKAIVSDDVGEVLTFKDVTFGPHEGELRFWLIHFWEAWNIRTKVLIGLEMLMIDEESKTIYRVADSDVTISFSWNSVLTVIKDSPIHFPEDRFPLQGCREFVAACDSKGDLYDYVGHIKLVNGQIPSDSLLLDEAQIADSRRVELHVQTHDDPVLKVCLWDQAAFEFVAKYKASGYTARVILVTTLNPKRFGGVASVSTTAPSRVFMDGDKEETRNYLSWLNSNLDVANRVNAEVVTKTEKETLGNLFSYMKKTSAKANEVVEEDHIVPVPQAMVDTIGQTRTFIVKVSTHNLTGKTQALTVTKVLPVEAPVVTANLGVSGDKNPDIGGADEAAEPVKRGLDGIELDGAKRARCG